jgi:predicted RNA-binding Zn-ribbon protein involved in translation (DUF1610 family)
MIVESIIGWINLSANNLGAGAMKTALLLTRYLFASSATLILGIAAVLFHESVSLAEEAKFEARTWTDKKGNQLTSTFHEAKNGEVQLKNDAGEVQKFKLADFSEPDQKYLRDLAVYRRKLAAGENPPLPVDPALASLDIQPRQTISEPVPDMPPFRKPLMEFPIRVWTDATGKKVQGKFVTAYNDKIVLDVKGNAFDLPITRLSSEDQEYVAVQLRGLQRDDLFHVLAKAATKTQQPPNGEPAPAAAPAPNTVAAETPPAAVPLSTDDIRARLEQLKAQRGGNTDSGTQVAANTPSAQPLSNDDIKARLAQIRQEKGIPEPEFIPAAPIETPPAYTPPTYTPPTPVTGYAAEPSGPMFRMGKQCMSCRKEVPGHLTAGDKCPHCGVFFGHDMTNGKKSSAPFSAYGAGQIAGYIFLGISVLAGLGKLIGKISG